MGDWVRLVLALMILGPFTLIPILLGFHAIIGRAILVNEREVRGVLAVIIGIVVLGIGVLFLVVLIEEVDRDLGRIFLSLNSLLTV